MLAAESHPFVAAFIFYILSLGITFLGIGFLERYAWLRTSSNLYALLQFVGMLMVVLGGLWAAFQVHLGRILGYAVLMETGLSLLTVSLGPGGEQLPPSLEILFSSLLPRGLALGIWALALTTLAAYGEGEGEFEDRLSFNRVQGKGRKFPIAVGLLVIANLSLAGFPLLAGFPVHLALWNALAQKSTLAAVAALLGSLGLLTGCMRSLAVLITGSDEVPWVITERWSERIMFLLGGAVLLLVGILPQWFLPALARMTQVYLSGQP
jgi:formate hydrogenlyase subunit 3/multisubunit Na+/H+ antiporter MnhD subunit